MAQPAGCQVEWAVWTEITQRGMWITVLASVAVRSPREKQTFIDSKIKTLVMTKID